MLICPSSDKRISSTLGGLIGSGEAPPLLTHPKDAAPRSLGHGVEVRVWNDRGEVILRLDVTDDVPPGVVASEKGASVDEPHRADDLGSGLRGSQGRSRRRRLLQRHPGRGKPGLMQGPWYAPADCARCRWMRNPSTLMCITLADVRKGCGWPTFRSGVRTIESAPEETLPA
jgi:hypothetical protein